MSSPSFSSSPAFAHAQALVLAVLATFVPHLDASSGLVMVVDEKINKE
jgi:hypothetical protein